MTPVELARWRLHSLGLLGGARFDGAADVVGWLGAVQSQDHAPAKWALAQRTRSAASADAAIDRAFDAGAILRTHVLRPTWHFVRPSDIRWMLALTAPRIRRFMAYYDRQLALDGKTLAKAHAVIARELEGGAQRTRRELEAALGRARITGDGQRMGHIMMHAELDALVCSGAMRGKQHTYALLEARVPPARAIDPAEAAVALATRYFTSHGPATAKDFAWWSSLTVAEIKRALAHASLEHREIDGITYWFAGAPPRATRAKAPVVQLLQGYDEYAVGYTESKYVLDVSGAARAARPAGRAAYNGLILVDTQLRGHWKRTIGPRDVAIETSLYAPLDRTAARALRTAAEQHAAFLGRSLVSDR